MKYFLGIDPGSNKFGIAIVTENKELVYKNIIKEDDCINVLKSLIEEYDIEDVVVGNGSGSKKLINFLKIIRLSRLSYKKNLNVFWVNERNTTIEAIRLFIGSETNLFKKIFNFIKSIFLPLDDYAAYVIVCRYLSFSNPYKHSKKI